MIVKKNLYPIYIILIVIFFSLQSFEKNKSSIPEKKSSPEVKKLLDLGIKYYHNEKFDSSYYYFNKAKSVAEIKKDTAKIIYSIVWMAEIQNGIGDYYSSEATAIEAFPFFENNNKFPYSKWSTYNLLGNNYVSKLDYDNALYYYNKAYKLNPDVISNAEILSNIAWVYMFKKSYKKAIEILLPLISNKVIANNKYAYSHIIENLGIAYYRIGNSTKGIALLYKSLKIKKEIKDEVGIISSYFDLSRCYIKTNPTLANYYSLLTYKTAIRLKRPNDQLEILRFIIENSPGDKSKKYTLIYLNLNDSLQKVRQKAKNQFAKIKYDFKKEKEENRKLKAEKELQQELEKNKNIVIIFIIVIIIIASGFVYYYLIEKNKKEKLKTAYNTEIRIAKKLHDELANDIYQTIAFAETQDLSTPNNAEKLLDSLDSIYTTTRNISRENNLIETGSLFPSNLKEMISGFDHHSINLMINGLDEIDWTSLENFKKITIYRVLQELLVNMKKHSQCSVVIVSFKKQENNLLLNYSDNGIGINLDKKIKKNGLQNIENRIIAINGTITFDSNVSNGVKINISIPI
jgi:signal transduction histidine kinase